VASPGATHLMRSLIIPVPVNVRNCGKASAFHDGRERKWLM
jgi:hypothetical protein